MGLVAGGLALAGSASPAFAEGVCVNEALRSELRSGGLPDCRGYEMVSPVYKEGFFVGKDFSSRDGSHLIGSSLGAFAGALNNTGVVGSYYEYTRTSLGWSIVSLDPPSTPQLPQAELLTPSADLSRTLWNMGEMLEGQGPGQGSYLEKTAFYRREHDGSFIRIGGSYLTPFVGASADLEHVLVRSGAHHHGGGETIGLLSEYRGSENSAPIPVGVSGGAGSTSPLSQCGTELGSSLTEGSQGSSYNAISADGSTVFFTANACASGPEVNELYARIGGSKTVDVSEPSSSGCTEAHCLAAEHSEGVFEGASEDGSKVFFLTEQPLLDSDPDGRMDLYEAEIEDGALKRLIQVSHDPTPGQAARVQGVTRVSADGSHVYFVAWGVLAGNSNGQGGQFSTAQEGADNLYVYSEGHTKFIAALCSGEGESGFETDLECHSSDKALWQRQDSRPVEATPDGRFLVFTSTSDLTSDDTSTVAQVFEFDAQSGQLRRVSIGQHGYNENGNTSSDPALITSPFYLARETGPAEAESHLSVSGDGAYVFFQSGDGLTPQALNNQIQYKQSSARGIPEPFVVQNVYEYHDGNVYLISDGRDLSAGIGGSTVELLGTSESGGDVFFATADQLVPQDTDTQGDLYDARIGGGFAAPAPAAGCAGEGCRSGLAPTPVLPGLGGSSITAGGGNLMAPGSVVAAHKKAKAKKKRRARGRGKAKRAAVRGRSRGQRKVGG